MKTNCKRPNAPAESLAIAKLRDQMKSSLLWRNLGSLYSLQRRDEEPLRFAGGAENRSRTRKQTQSHRADPEQLSVMYYRHGKMNKAEDVFNEAVRVLPMTEGLDARADLLNNLGAVYHAKREFKKAEDYITRALNMAESQVGPRHPDLTFQLASLGILYTNTGQYAKAEEQFQRALAILEPAASAYETRIARLLHGLSRTYAAAGRKADSEATLARAVVLARKNVAAHPDMALIMDEYAERLRNAGKKREAEELRVEARLARIAAGLVVNAHSPF
jgi:tetratricopeptide (TPR) repeat protein